MHTDDSATQIRSVPSESRGWDDHGPAIGPTPTFDQKTTPRGMSSMLVASLLDAFEQRRLFLLLPFASIAGILTWISSPVTPQLWAGYVAVGAIAIALWLLRHRVLVRSIMVLALFFWLGFLVIAHHANVFGTRMLDRALYGQFQFEISSIISADTDGIRAIGTNIVELDTARPLNLSKARLFLPTGDFPPGTIITARTRLYPVPGPVTPTGYDSQFQSYFDGIGAYGSVFEITSTKPPLTTGWQPGTFLFDLRATIAKHISTTVPEREAAILAAIVVGDQSQLSEQTRDIMAGAGLAHLLAISGLHLSLVAGGIFWLTQVMLSLFHVLTARQDVRRIAAIAGALVALIYLGLSGASVSAIRATIMILLVFGAMLAGRKALTMRNVAIAALIVLAFDPSSVLRASFQLSFAAVVALVGIYEISNRTHDTPDSWPTRIIRYVLGLALTSLIAGMATTLFAAYHFQNVAPLGMLANILALPIAGFIMLPSAFLGLVTMPFGWDAPFFHVAAGAVDWVFNIAEWTTGFDISGVAVPLVNSTGLLIMLTGFAPFVFMRGWIKLAGPAISLVVFGLFGLTTPPDILVADSTTAIAIRSADTYFLIQGRSGSFTTNAWERTYQLLPSTEQPSGLQCDQLGCVMFTQAENEPPDRVQISFALTMDALNEDCNQPGIIITRQYAPTWCASSDRVFDLSRIRSLGGFALRMSDNNVLVEPNIANPKREWRPGASIR